MILTGCLTGNLQGCSVRIVAEQNTLSLQIQNISGLWKMFCFRKTFAFVVQILFNVGIQSEITFQNICIYRSSKILRYASV